MITTVQICNLALAKLAQERISSLSENTKVARYCNEFFGVIRDDELSSYPWSFAMNRATPSSDATGPEFEWAYRYQLPGDCLRPWGLYNTTAEWIREGDFILTNESSINLWYIRRVTDSGQFDPAFINVFACRLAYELASIISGKSHLRDRLLHDYREAIVRAKSADAMQGNRSEDYQRGRFVMPSWATEGR